MNIKINFEMIITNSAFCIILKRKKAKIHDNASIRIN